MDDKEGLEAEKDENEVLFDASDLLERIDLINKIIKEIQDLCE